MGLIIPDVAPPPPTPKPLVQIVEVQSPSFDLDDLDDYAEDETRLKLVDPPAPAPTVIVEACELGFWVSRLRDNGTSSASVLWSRKELQELQRRINAALRMTDDD